MQIKEGATRIVFVFDRIVVKIPTIFDYKRFLCGLLANLEERLWSGYHADLAKVICSSRIGLYVVMERAEEVTDMTDDELWKVLCDRYKEKAEDDFEKVFLLSDCKASNWGRISGRLVKIDYGD